MGFLDKAKAAAEQATAKAKEGVEEVQSKRELAQAYGELGRATYGLIESGELSHAQLAPIAERIRSLEDGTGPDAPATAEAQPSDQPPAMPV
jgi:hypothetical protein